MKNDLKGNKYGRLTVTGKSGLKRSKGGHSSITWNCLCDCGNEVVLTTSALTSGNTKSCGCYKKDRNSKIFTKHGMSETKLYKVWSSIKDRCFREYNKQYRDYGGRGITVCDEWKRDFKYFYDWAIENGYQDGLTIERKDNDGNYCPENCCWIKRTEQSKNRRNCHYITYSGVTKTLSEWCRELHVDRETLRRKEKEMMDGEKALEFILNSKRHITCLEKRSKNIEL